MTPEKVKLVQDSFKLVAPIADTAADIFYDRLFEVAPGVRPLFKDDMAGQKKALMGMIATAVSSLHEVEKIVPAVQELGKKHVGYGAEPAHYDVVGECLLYTLEKGLGEAWTPDLKEAWTETYVTLATVMKEAAAEVPPPASEKKKGFLSRMFS